MLSRLWSACFSYLYSLEYTHQPSHSITLNPCSHSSCRVQGLDGLCAQCRTPTKAPLAAGRRCMDQLTHIAWGCIHFLDKEDRTLPAKGSSPCARFFACRAFLPALWRWVSMLGGRPAG